MNRLIQIGLAGALPLATLTGQFHSPGFFNVPYFGEARGIVSDGGNNIVACGSFNTGTMTEAALRFDASTATWSPLNLAGDGFAIRTLANGDLAVGGTNMQNTSAGVAVFDGTSWTVPGGSQPLELFVFDLSEFNGQLVACGVPILNALDPAIALFDGTNWVTVGSGTTASSAIFGMATDANGGLVVCGDFGITGASIQDIARWDGVSWQAIGAASQPTGPFESVAVAPNGDILASTASVGGTVEIHRFDGTAWQLVTFVPGWSIRDITICPDGDLLIAGDILATDVGPLVSFARITGSTFIPLTTSTAGPGSGFAIEILPTGLIAGGGAFTTVNGIAENSLAAFFPANPATATTWAPGCAGNTQTVTSLAWLGGTFGSTATGLFPNSLVLQVRGLAPYAGPSPLALFGGCALTAQPDLIDAFLADPLGVVAVGFPVPDVSTLIGQTLWHQVVSLDPATGLGTTTQSLAITIGDI